MGARAPVRDTSSGTVASALMHRCAGGDHEALAELHELFHRPLVRLARGIVRTTEEAEEVVQEVFLYVWQRAASYDSRRSAVSTWLRRIAQSRAIDHLRKRRTLERARSSAAGESVVLVEPRFEHDVYIGEWRQRLHRALEGLPAAQRQAIRLAYYGELTQREIADRVRIPLGTVKTRTLLAMTKLRAEFRDVAAGETRGAPGA